MKLITGKLNIIFCTIFPVMLNAAHLSIKDTQATAVAEVGLHELFIVELMVEQSDRRMNPPHIPGLENFQTESRHTKMQMINGKSSTTYSFYMRCHKTGTYTLGPVSLSTGSKTFRSNAISLTVTHEKKKRAEDQKKKQEQGATAFARLEVGTIDAVIGQKIPCTLTLYSSNGDYQIQHIAESPTPEFLIQSRSGPIVGKKIMQGTIYYYSQWNWDLIPQQEGTFTIPAYQCDFSVPDASREDDFFSLFFHRSRQSKRVYSNAVQLAVKKLPPCERQLHAIGIYHDFAAELQNQALQQGQGTILKLKLMGDGQFLATDPLSLAALPDALKWYESKKYTEQDVQNPGQIIHYFEYIVQGMKAGQWTIPAQEFHFYDTQKKKYETLTTEPIVCTVIASVQTPQMSAENQQQLQQDIQQSPSEDNNNNHIRPIHEEEWRVTKDKKVPWKFFFILVLGIWSFALLPSFSFFKKNTISASYSYAQALYELKQAEREKKLDAVYAIFSKVWAQQEGNMPLSETEHEQWNQFYEKISATHFSNEPLSGSDNNELFKQAFAWLQRFQKKM